MAELPLLFFPRASTEAPADRGRGGSNFKKPSPAEQKARLDEKFRTIAESFKDLTASVEGLEPEQVIVIETFGAVKDLAKAASKIPGLEWLTELELEEGDPGEGFEDKKDATKKLPRRLYAVMSNQKAIDRLIGLWKNWLKKPNERAKPKFGPFKTIFEHLKDVRRWSVKDRIAETRVVEYWEETLKYEKGNIRFEVELWCRGDPNRRKAAYDNLRQIIVDAGGQCVSGIMIREILYYGVLAELPAAKIKETINKITANSDTSLLRCEDVMFFRPHAQSVFPCHEPAEDGETAPAAPKKTKKPKAVGDPVIALLDGLPLAHHDALDGGRLILDDPDNHAAYYKPRQQEHGTAMASLIVHGDLSVPGNPLPRPIYVRPIMRPYEDFDKNVEERTPHDRLLVDLIHTAVVGIKGTEKVKGAAPSVMVINFSIGNRWQPFFRDLSPLARLLDWLAWKYQILFIVSVGNQSQPIEPAFTTTDITTLPDEEVQARTLEALHQDQVSRRPFAPAEAMNALTVGAVHADQSNWAGDQRVDLLRGARFPSPISTIASGYKRSVKPDILFPAGRQLYLKGLSTKLPPRFSLATSSKPPGICVATPGELPMELGRMTFSRGTSNATALATRTAALIFERLLALKAEPGGERLTSEYYSVILKALLVHGASWGTAADLLDTVFGATVTDWREMLRLKARFLGYGEVEPNRALFSEDKRVLMLGWDKLFCKQGHDYSVPLPPSLSGKKVKRRLTVSLAWFSPLNPRHKDYRQALLWISPEKEKLELEKKDLDHESSRRGTVQHQIFEGDTVRAFADGDKLVVKVSCAAEAGKLIDYIPYALAVTLEVAEPVNLKIFTEMKDRIWLKVGITPKSS
jgi:hypothetical protein